jgi:hypothetical protein
VRQQHEPNGSVLVTVDAFLHPAPAHSTGRLAVSIFNSSSGTELWGAEQAIAVPGCAPASCPAPHGPPFASPFHGPGSPQADCAGEPAAAGEGGAAEEASAGPLGSCAGTGGLGAVRRRIAVLVTHPYELWWPHEFGGQALYLLRLTYIPDNSNTKAPEGAGVAYGGGGESSLER